MRAEQFNPLVQELLVKPLVKEGFVKYKNDMVLNQSNWQLVLFRLRNKWSNATQSTMFLLCFRHNFLRDIGKELPEDYLIEPVNYPAQRAPNTLRSGLNQIFNKWHYVPLKSSKRDKQEVWYGHLSEKEATKVLTTIAESILTQGIKWAESLSPEVMLRQIKKYGTDAYIEKIWIEDYEKHLAKTE